MAIVTQRLKLFLIIVGSLAGLLLLAVLAFVLFFDINHYKPRVEEALSDALRMSVTIEGPLGLTLLPGLRVKMENVRIRNHGTELAFAKELDVAIQYLPLFQKEIRYSSIASRDARISIERDRDGTYNYQRPPGDVPSARTLDLPKVSFADLTVVYADQQSKNGVELSTCNGELSDMRHPGSAPFLKRLSLTGQFTCGAVRGKSQLASDLKFSVVSVDGVFDFKPITLLAYGSQGSAALRMDRSLDVPTLDLHVTLPKFRIEELLKPQASGRSISGLMDFSANLSMVGKTRLAIRQSARGDMSLSGSNLTLNGIALDEQLQKFELTQNLSLLDVSALLFAGPISLVVTKGIEFTGLSQQTGTSTPIRAVVSKWKVEKGIAHATDVALTTNANRIAVQGGLDFVDDKYEGIVVGLLDAKGCAKARQKISGPFKKPVADKFSLLIPVGPILKLLDKARTLVTGEPAKCDAFYSGSLPQPK